MSQSSLLRSATWLAVIQGNTHQRWGWFADQTLLQVDRFPATPPPPLPDRIEIWIAEIGSSISSPQRLDSSRIHRLTLDQIPMANAYETLGLDRALGLLAAGKRWGWPSLVIDAGTALTLSGGDPEGRFLGGAILAGLGLHARSLHLHTATLPCVELNVDLNSLPPRWARSTVTAIQSGILYTISAGLRDYCRDWLRRFPQSAIVITGGDGDLVFRLVQEECRDHALILEPSLILYGISDARNWLIQQSPKH